MRGTVAKKIRRLAKMIEANPQYKGVPFKVIYKDLKKNYKGAKRSGRV